MMVMAGGLERPDYAWYKGSGGGRRGMERRKSSQAAPILEVFKTCLRMGNLGSLGEFRWIVFGDGGKKKG